MRRKLLIANEWIDTPDTLAVRRPYSGDVVAKAGPDEAERAVRAAVRAFEETRRLPSVRRAEILGRAAAGLQRRREDLARAITLESGKPIKLSRGEVERAILTFTTAQEEAKRIGGDVVPLDLTAATAGRLGLTRRFPLGPILGITPFNFPLNLVAHKVAPAVAAGNSIVIKPASATPTAALMLGEILLEADMPAGMVNIVPMSSELAERLVADERFRLLTFTGSNAVGWDLKRKAGKKRVVLELGGNAGVIVHDDASLPLALERCVAGGYAQAGQSCISVQRIYVQDRVYEEFARSFVERVLTLSAGDPLDEKADVGPMIDEEAARRVEEWVDEAVRGGAAVLCGGKRDGRFYAPTVLADVKPEMKVHDREVFGPVVNLYRYRDFAEALREINASAFGLQAGVFTQDVGRVFQAFETLEVGGVIVNDASTFRVDPMPYGGEKDSGLGREGLRYAIEEMTQLRLLALNLKT
ncbi:MAG: aldehyde dehydrogenase family protein [Planctomycetes bacterium]|nr:aldehyde dehydrogenase family protein [Planctomycetota bacterium]